MTDKEYFVSLGNLYKQSYRPSIRGLNSKKYRIRKKALKKHLMCLSRIDENIKRLESKFFTIPPQEYKCIQYGQWVLDPPPWMMPLP